MKLDQIGKPGRPHELQAGALPDRVVLGGVHRDQTGRAGRGGATMAESIAQTQGGNAKGHANFDRARRAVARAWR